MNSTDTKANIDLRNMSYTYRLLKILLFIFTNTIEHFERVRVNYI